MPIFLSLIAGTVPTIVIAQDTPPLVPGLDNFDLSGPRARATPAPRATPSARPTPAPTRAPAARPTTPTRVPAVRPTPTSPTPTPTPRPTPAPTRAAVRPAPVPTAVPVPAATVPPTLVVPPTIPDTSIASDRSVATPAPIATASPASAPAPGVPKRHRFWMNIYVWMLGMLALIALAIGLGVYLFRRARRPDKSGEIALDGIADLPPIDDETMPTPHLAAPGAAPPGTAPPAAAPAPFAIKETPPTPRARLEIGFRPIRAGTNLTGAAVDYEVDIRNIGDAAATGIRLDLRLLTASADQDAILAALYAAPIDRPSVAPFDLDAGQQVALGGMMMIPNEAISVMTVRTRDFFVPLMSINLVYGWGGAARGQSACAYVIGVERQDETKMAPFRLDTGPRMFDRVGARAHSLVVER